MENSLDRPLRVGRIDYTNVWPVTHFFDPEHLEHPVEQIWDMPAVLNRRLREGTIDLSGISSFAYGESSKDYYLLPDLSVSSHGAVKSVLLFLKSPLEKVIQGRIAVSSTSATSVNLLKIIIGKFMEGRPVYQQAEPSLADMLEHADAALLIGDHAIRASWSNPGYEVLDMGELWHRYTGHWMTFAVWAVRRDAADRHPEQVRSVYERLLESKRLCKQDPASIVNKAVQQIGGTPQYWREYFANLNHDFGPGHKAGLELYFRYARDLGLIDEEVNLKEWPLA
jgi:chorismate dehydratase